MKMTVEGIISFWGLNVRVMMCLMNIIKSLKTYINYVSASLKRNVDHRMHEDEVAASPEAEWHGLWCVTRPGWLYPDV
jgi:hypothetical protein